MKRAILCFAMASALLLPEARQDQATGVTLPALKLRVAVMDLNGAALKMQTWQKTLRLRLVNSLRSFTRGWIEC